MQKKTMFRKSIWSWALALVLVLQFLAPVEIRAAETTVQVKVENLAVDEAAGAPWTGNLTSLDMDWTEGMTALEALITYSEAQDIEVQTSKTDFGTMINSIHGLGSSLVPDGASWSSWMYDVNGKQPEVGIDSHVLSAGDVLNFSFTVSYPSIQVNVTNEMVTVEQGAPWVGTIEELPYQGEYFYNIPGSENVTALEVFQIYAENNAIEYEIVDAEFGKYLKTINGLGSDSIIENAKWPGWLFSVNGTFATAGMADTVLEPGDTLDIHFTVTWEEESTTETSETDVVAPVDENFIEVPAQWPSFRGNTSNNAYITNAVDLPTTAEETELLWSKDYSPSSWSNYPSQGIIVENNLVFIQESTLWAISLDTGEVSKQATLTGSQGYASTAPIYADGLIFISLNDGKVEAYRAQDFTRVWTYQNANGGQGQSPLTYHDGILFVGFYQPSKEASLVAVDAKTGSQRWEHVADEGFYFAGGMVIGNVYVTGSESNAVASYDLNTGEVVSTFSTKAKVRSSVVGSGANFYVADNGGTLYKFQVDASGQLNVVHAVDLDNAVTASPVITNDQVYLPSVNTFYVLDANNLAIRTELTIPSYGQGSPLVAKSALGDQVFFTVNNKPGALYTFTVHSEGVSEVEALYIPEESAQNFGIASPIVSHDGTLIYRNDSGRIFALRKVESTEVVLPEETSTVTSSEELTETTSTVSEETSTVTTSEELTETTSTVGESSTTTPATEAETRDTSSISPDPSTSEAMETVPETGESISGLILAIILIGTALLLMVLLIFLRRRNKD